MKGFNYILSALCVASVGLSAAAESIIAEKGVATSHVWNAVGVLKVTPRVASGSVVSETIIAMPWIKCGKSNTDKAPFNSVLAQQMSNGDVLYRYNSDSDYSAWKYVASYNKWTGITKKKVTTDENGYPTIVDGSGTTLESETVLRSEALIVRRATSTTLGNPIYTVGQLPKGGDVGEIELKNGWNFVAPPTVTDFDLNGNSPFTGVTWDKTDASLQDNINFVDASGIPRELCWDGSQWYYTKKGSGRTRDTIVTDDVKVPAGQGFWYVKRGSTTPRVNYSKNGVQPKDSVSPGVFADDRMDWANQ